MQHVAPLASKGECLRVVHLPATYGHLTYDGSGAFVAEPGVQSGVSSFTCRLVKKVPWQCKAPRCSAAESHCSNHNCCQAVNPPKH